jgi:hypothetical protein
MIAAITSDTAVSATTVFNCHIERPAIHFLPAPPAMYRLAHTVAFLLVVLVATGVNHARGESREAPYGKVDGASMKIATERLSGMNNGHSVAHESRQLMYGWMDAQLEHPQETQVRLVKSEFTEKQGSGICETSFACPIDRINPPDSYESGYGQRR